MPSFLDHLCAAGYFPWSLSICLGTTHSLNHLSPWASVPLRLPFRLSPPPLLCPSTYAPSRDLLQSDLRKDLRCTQAHLQHRVAIHEPKHPRLQLDRDAKSGPTRGRAGFPRTDALQGDVLPRLHMHRALRKHRHRRGP